MPLPPGPRPELIRTPGGWAFCGVPVARILPDTKLADLWRATFPSAPFEPHEIDQYPRWMP